MFSPPPGSGRQGNLGGLAFNNIFGVCVCLCVSLFDSPGQLLGCTRNSNSTDFKNKGRNPEPFCENSQGKLFYYYFFPSCPIFFVSEMCFLDTSGASLLWICGAGFRPGGSDLTSLGRDSCGTSLTAYVASQPLCAHRQVLSAL